MGDNKKIGTYFIQSIFYIGLIVLIVGVFTMSLKALVPNNVKKEIRSTTSKIFYNYGVKVYKSAIPMYKYTANMGSYDGSQKGVFAKYIENNFPIGQYMSKQYFGGTGSELYTASGELDGNTDENGQEILKEVEEHIEEVKSKEYTLGQLKNHDFLLSTFFTVDSTTYVRKSELNIESILKKKFNVNLTSKKPKVLIYHTHGSEAYANSRSGVQSDTVIGVGEELTKILEKKYNVTVIHDKKVYDTINGKLDRSKAYNLAAQSIAKILEKNPSIEVVIDLHRDGVASNTRLVTKVDGESTAKIMFFNGVSRKVVNNKPVDLTSFPNPYVKSNLALSLQLQLQAAKDYPGFTRRIYIKGYRYNQHLRDKSILVEVGAQTNTVKEAKNAMAPLADLLNEVLTRK